MGEQESDTGGLTRHFFPVVARHTSAKYVEKTGCFKHYSVAFQICCNVLSLTVYAM